MAKVENVDHYLKIHDKWAKPLTILRNLLLSFNLEETIKWGSPVYMKDAKNLIGLAAFKNHYGIWFFQGALLKENSFLLANAQDGKTQAMRQIKFDENSVLDLETIKPYFAETIALHHQGKVVKLTKFKIIEIPLELKIAFSKVKNLKTAFDILTLGKQKEYSLYINEAKREAAKQSRLNKIIPMILEGIGLNDKYKSC
tara:strand:+ start:1288 stop:1884 length:597 start_codon:yes stop_codon:yes gene_type:complete